jgi:Reverse transcriptase (RNA-dependent DNA polymerase)
MSDRPGRSSPPVFRRPPRWESTPKPSGERRWLVRLDPRDDLGYDAAVARVAPTVERNRPIESRAGGVVGWDRRTGIVFEPWTTARRRWRRDVGRLLPTSEVVVLADVRDCYGSIAPAVVMEGLRRSGARGDASQDVQAWLAAFTDAGIRGLPVGPPASAVLAEAVLSRGDMALRASGVAHIRWVDDVAVFAGDRRIAVRALDALRRAWARSGLEAHDGKTVVVDRAEAAVRFGAIGSGPPGSSPLR